MISALETALNWIVDKINSLEIVNPFNGEEIWSPNIPRFSFSRIPKLATGTVVPANFGEFTAILGDNKREPEIVSPLSTMKQALREVMAEAGGMENKNITVVMQVNKRELGRVVYELNNEETQRVGISFRKGGAMA